MLNRVKKSLIVFALLTSFTLEARTVEQMKETIAFYVSLSDDRRDYQEIWSLAREVLSVTSLYDNETLAQVYLLLAYRAENIGDFSKAYQFAERGLRLKDISIDVKLMLLLRAAQSNYNRGKYQQVLTIADTILNLAKKHQTKPKYAIHATTFKAMANALLGNYDLGMQDLSLVTSQLEFENEYAEYIDVMETLAVANSYLGDYQTALQLQEKLINLRYKLGRTANLEQSFYNLASVYEQLGRYDDAYTWYLESKNKAQAKGADIRLAFAELGIGKVLLAQQQYHEAYKSLEKAERIFKGLNLNKPYLTTLINLAKAYLGMDEKKKAYHFLTQAMSLAELTNLTIPQLDLYKLMAKMYNDRQQYALAFQALNEFNTRKEKFYKHELATLLKLEKARMITDESRKIALNMADIGELEQQFEEQVARVKQANVFIALIASVVMIIALWLWFKYKNLQSHQQRDVALELTKLIPTTEFTRQVYQREFKEARHFQYPIVVVLLKVANWREITYKFDKKIVKDVYAEVTQLLADNIGDYDKVGQLGDSEFLMLFPHKSPEQVAPIMSKIAEDLSLRFFANIGEQIVSVVHVSDMPGIQDIDPYIFLAKMSDSLSANELK